MIYFTSDRGKVQHGLSLFYYLKLQFSLQRVGAVVLENYRELKGAIFFHVKYLLPEIKSTTTAKYGSVEMSCQFRDVCRVLQKAFFFSIPTGPLDLTGSFM